MYEVNKKKFGSFVSERRKEKGFTQKELAARLFISDKAISKWETGVSIPDAGLWVSLAELLGVTVTELLMGESMAPKTQIASDDVENLVQTAISCADTKPELNRGLKHQRAVLFFVCLLAGALENLYLYTCGLWSKQLLVLNLMGVLFGAYFMLFAKTRLPAYYDENKITTYSDGFFRINMVGLAFNNSNWPHILTVARIWTMAVLAGYPLLYGLILIYLPSVQYITLALALGGLFVPMYIVGRKYR